MNTFQPDSMSEGDRRFHEEQAKVQRIWQVKENALERKFQAEENQKDRDHQSAENQKNRENWSKKNKRGPTMAADTRSFSQQQKGED